MLKIYSPGSYVRFLSALPQEYGMLFIFPAAVLAIRFFQEYTKQRSEQEIEKKQWRAKRVKGYLAGFAISFSLTLTAHFYDTIPAGVLCVGIAVGFFRMLFKWRYFWQVARKTVRKVGDPRLAPLLGERLHFLYHQLDRKSVV